MPKGQNKTFACVQQVTKIRVSEAGRAASRRRLEDLLRSLLHRAFNREL